MNDKEKLLLLGEASSVVLGYLIGKHGFDDPAAAILAKALSACDVDSGWTRMVLDKARQKGQQ